MRAVDQGLWVCRECHKLNKPANSCSRCGAALYPRVPRSISRSWALLVAAAICYVPANLLPIMTVSYFGKGEPSTIISGIIDLINNGMIPIAAVVFVASIVVPTFKLIGLAWLLISVQRKRAMRARQRMFLFRFIEWIGRWSMLDIFVIAILVTLVNFGNFANVDANPGAIAFAAVVILTMLAAKTFDPRLIWDHACSEDNDE